MTTDWLELSNKVVIVTGGSSGIGKAVVDTLLKENVQVVNADLRPSAEPSDALFVQTDVTSGADIKKLVKQTLDTYGKIDGLVNNAGINMPRLLADEKTESEYELDEATFDKMVAVNQKAVFLLSQAVAKQMIQQKSGVIVNMSSESGLEGSQGQSCYAATKAAVNSFTRSWSKELGLYGIRVVGVAPGIMEETGLRTLSYETALAYTRNISVEDLRAGYAKTSTIPLNRSGRLEEVADVVAYFLSERSSYVTGVTVNVAGGKTRG